MKHQGIRITRRALLLPMAAGGLWLVAGRTGATTYPSMTVWKDPSCGCCGAWIEHLRRNGLAVSVIETTDVQSIKAQRRVPAELASCHTAEIGGYTIEGHVPSAAIMKLLAERPRGHGLAVPGMPAGPPGMEGGRPEKYQVMLFGDGEPRTYASFVGESPA